MSDRTLVGSVGRERFEITRPVATVPHFVRI